MYRKININITFECNSNCTFCAANHEIVGQVGRISFEEMCQLLDKLKLDETDEVILSGGEPTIHPEFFDIAHRISESKCKLSMLTNGRMFAKKDFVEKIKGCNFSKICIPIHGMEKTHDLITRSNGSFLQTEEGIKNLRKIAPEIHLELKYVVCKLNYAEIKDIQEFILKMNPDDIMMSTLFQTEVAQKNSQIVEKTELLKAMTDAVEFLMAANYKGDIFVYGVPLCLFDNSIVERLVQNSNDGFVCEHEFEELYFDYTRKDGVINGTIH